MGNNSAFFMQRLNDHIQYLSRVTKTLADKDDFHGTDCHSCKLGKWIDSSGREDVVAHAPHAEGLFERLVERHEYFHSVSNEVLAKHQVGDTVNCYRAMTEMHKVSGQLVSLLLDIDRKVKVAA